MNNLRIAFLDAAVPAAAGALLLVASSGAMSQPSSSSPSPNAPASPSTSTSTSTSTASPASGGVLTVQSERGPYYLGLNQALTNDSNVYRVPSGPSDNYSSTSLRAGFDQPISRQRVFGSAVVSVNRYQRAKDLDNTSYTLDAGLAWETIGHLSGGLTTSLARGLTAPPATAGVPTPARNIAETRNVEAVARWGGVSLLTLEGTAGWSGIDYSDPAWVQSDSTQSRGGLALYYSPGGPLRLGVGGHVVRTDTPDGILDPVTGAFQPTKVTSTSADLHAGYQVTGLISANGRLSYTWQTSSGIGSDEVSGWTGSLGLNWRPTGKVWVALDASRDAGYDATAFATVQILNNNGVLTMTPVTGLYQNNRVTDSAGIGVGHETTAKINLWANARYMRGRAVSSGLVVAGGSPDTVDIGKFASIGANYEIKRYWSAACSFAQEWRDVSGATPFAYTARTVSCSTQITLR